MELMNNSKNKLNSKISWQKLKSQLIFITIHGSHDTFWYYLWALIYYFS